MDNYPLFRAPDHVWDNIQSQIGHKKNNRMLFSVSLYYKKVSLGVGALAALLFIVGLTYNGSLPYIPITQTGTNTPNLVSTIIPSDNKPIITHNTSDELEEIDTLTQQLSQDFSKDLETTSQI